MNSRGNEFASDLEVGNQVSGSVLLFEHRKHDFCKREEVGKEGKDLPDHSKILHPILCRAVEEFVFCRVV